MGGLLFGTNRLSVDEFNLYRKNIENILKSNNIEYKIPLYFEDKKDFGDLDVIVYNDLSNHQILKIFDGYTDFYKNGDVILSLNYNNFQIDFIKIEKENFDISYHYFSWNDLGNLIGQLAKQIHLKFGQDGLKYDYYNNGRKFEINISKNIDKILQFLDLEPLKFHDGFKNLDEIFHFIIKSKYFNPYVSELNPYDFDTYGKPLYRLNKINRDRNHKRKTYIEWLKFIDKYKTDICNYKFKENYNIDDILKEINLFFPDCEIYETIEKINYDNKINNIIKTKFNGNIIMNLIPIKGEIVGKFIFKYKSSFIDHNYFKEFILNNDQKIINESLIKYYKLDFKE